MAIVLTVAIFLFFAWGNPGNMLTKMPLTMPNTFQERIKTSMSNLEYLSEPGIEKLMSCVQERALSKGEYLLEEGKVCKKIYFVEKGFLRSFRIKEGNEINTGFTFENNFTTNLKSLRSGIPSEITIQAAEAGVFWELDKNELLELYRVSQEIESFGRKIVEMLSIRQEEYSHLFTLYDAKERYEYLLKNHPEIIQRVSLSQISSYLGVTRETLSRIRKQP